MTRLDLTRHANRRGPRLDQRIRMDVSLRLVHDDTLRGHKEWKETSQERPQALRRQPRVEI